LIFNGLHGVISHPEDSAPLSFLRNKESWLKRRTRAVKKKKKKAKRKKMRRTRIKG
jgi:hypothetical protein